MLALCAISVGLLASLPATAAAKRTVAEFKVGGSNGYTAYFQLAGNTASVDAIRTPSLRVLLSATYISNGRLEGDRIRARFGSRGRIAVEFRPSGEVRRRRPPRRCKGEPRVTRLGIFVGTIRFAGEGGYTSVDADRAKGKVRTAPRWRCGRRQGSPSRRAAYPVAGASIAKRAPFGLDPEAERFTVLAAESDDDGTAFTARAVRLQGRPGSTSFIATRLESRPSLRIVRFAFTDGTDDTFSFDEVLSTASATPPSPFAGSANFVRDAGGKVCVRYPCDRSSWLGSLSVDFPGADDVPLAGEGFRALLFREGLDGTILR
jgi:hypothetical protein